MATNKQVEEERQCKTVQPSLARHGKPKDLLSAAQRGWPGRPKAPHRQAIGAEELCIGSGDEKLFKEVPEDNWVEEQHGKS